MRSRFSFHRVIALLPLLLWACDDEGAGPDDSLPDVVDEADDVVPDDGDADDPEIRDEDDDEGEGDDDGGDEPDSEDDPDVGGDPLVDPDFGVDPETDPDAGEDPAVDGDADADPPVGVGTLTGQVLMPVGEDFAPIPGARVWVEGLPEVRADDDGAFAIRDVPAGLVRVFAAGPPADRRTPAGRLVYSTTSMTVDLEIDEIQTVLVRLLLGCSVNVDFFDGGLIDLPSCGSGGAVRLGFPPDAFERPSGVYPVAVRVELAVLDPTNARTFAAIPMAVDGSSLFETADVLGGLEVRLSDAVTGEPLSLAEGAAVLVRVPAYAPNDEEDVEVLVYDDLAGEWVSEWTGAFTELGDTTYFEYDAEHFSTQVLRETLAATPSGCLRVYPLMGPEALPVCPVDSKGQFTATCPDRLGLEAYACDDGMCTCDGAEDCPFGHTCTDDGCVLQDPVTDACTSTFADCRGDTVCLDGMCRQVDATMDMYYRDGLGSERYSGTVFGGLDECHPAWAEPRTVHVDIRYVNDLGVLLGQPVYRWQNRGVANAFPQLESLRDFPTEVVDIAAACAARDPRCELQDDPRTGRPIVLAPMGRSCALGRAVENFPDGFGGEAELPVSGLFQLRGADGQVVATTVADADGRFCVTTPMGVGDLTMTQGPYPEPGYYTMDVVPGAEGGRCGDGHLVPPQRCANLGTVRLDCYEGEGGEGSCMRALFQTEVFPEGDPASPNPTWRIELDASESTGTIRAYEWEIWRGLWRDELVASTTQNSPQWEVSLPRGTYTIDLTLVSRQYRDWAFNTDRVVLTDDVLLPQSVSFFGCWLPFHLPTVCVSDDDCPEGQDCFDGEYCTYQFLAGWGAACDSETDCDDEDFIGRDGVDHLSCDLARAVCVSDFWPAADCPWEFMVPVGLSDFSIDRTEVTQARYELCVRDGACTEPDEVCGSYDPFADPDHPVTCVTHGQAADFCEWVGRRLPTSVEWEVAARGPLGVLGGCDPEEPLAPFCEVEGGDLFPWGSAFATGNGPVGCEVANVAAFPSDGSGSCEGQLVPVGSHPAGMSPTGALDMVGNASEWVADEYLEDPLVDQYIDYILEDPEERRGLRQCLTQSAWSQLDCTDAPLFDPIDEGLPGPVMYTVRGAAATEADRDQLTLLERSAASADAVSAFRGFRCAINSGDVDWEGPCPVGQHDGGEGDCMPLDQCAEGHHDGGGRHCVPDSTACYPGYHDGGEDVPCGAGSCAECVPLGFCSDGFHDGGNGTCVPLGSCSAGYHDGGNGSCVDTDVCAPGYYDADPGVALDCQPIPVGSGNDGLHVVLTWDTPGDPNPNDTGDTNGTDVDLHLWNGTGDWNTSPNDCYWNNLTPNWGDLGSTLDNPSGDVDDRDGWGPETIILAEPAGSEATPVTYHVGVHYWAERTFGPSDATVRVYIGGVLVGTWVREGLTKNDFWEVVNITYPPSAGDVTEVDTVRRVTWAP